MSGESGGEEAADLHTIPWQRLSEGLIGGIHHALNNRMGALSGATQVLETDLPPDHPLAGTMARELERFEETAGLLRLLTGGDGGFEPVQLAEVVAGARKLFVIHHALRDLRLQVESPPDLLPLWTQPAGLTRALLLMMAAAAEGCGSADGVVSMAIDGDEAEVRISVEVAAGGERDPGEVAAWGIGPGDVASLARTLGGSLETTDWGGGSRWTLALPTLPEVRRRERLRAEEGGGGRDER